MNKNFLQKIMRLLRHYYFKISSCVNNLHGQHSIAHCKNPIANNHFITYKLTVYLFGKT
jgi:hypothetical protein